MEMTENPKLEMASSCEVYGLEEKMSTQRISVSDHVNGFQYEAEESDSFVIDMESFSHGGNKEITANSRITLPRSFSRKGSLRGSDKKVNSNDRESGLASSSPRGTSMPEKAASMVAIGTTDHASNPQVHHQITITTANINGTTENKFTLRKNSFKRSSSSWAVDPKKVLLFFATLSSIGTMLLIFFTLSISKLNADETALN